MFKKTVLQSLFLLLFACFSNGCVESNSTRIPTENMPTSSPTPIPSIYDQTLPLFAYDSSAPFDLQVISEREKDGVVIQEILFQAANPGYTPGTAGKIPAYLVRPSQEGSYAGVLFVHGLGRGWGTKDQFLDEAVELAHQGVISLLPSGLFPWMIQHSGDAGKDTTNVIGQVIELRHALDFLISQPGVDSGRIAYVGHDYGAMHGAVLSGIEDRIKAYVLMAGDSSYSDWSITYFKKPADEAAYRSSMAAVDPITYLPHAAPARLYFQFGGQDGFVPDDSAERSFASASEPKQLDTYDTGHTLSEQAAGDRVDWLIQELELSPIQ